MPPVECINCGTCRVSFTLTLPIRQTTPALNNPLCQCVPTEALTTIACFISYKHPSASTSICKVSSFILHADFQAYSASLNPGINSFFLFQMAALNFECILMMLKDGGTIPRDTLCSQDGINLGDICFCPILRTLCMQHISLSGLCTLLSEGAFAPLQSNMPSKLSGMTAILLVFQVDSEHERIINVYVGLVVGRVDSHLYSPSQINNFIQDIEVDLWAACNALKTGCDPGKRCAYCLFVDNPSGVMSIPMDPPYCLVYPTTYIKGIEPNHFNTQNSPAGMHLHRCVCQATLQFSNNDPKQCTKYVGSHLIMPCGAQYNNHLYPSILELWNHRGPLIDPTTGEPCPMEVVGDFKAMDPIFKGCYRDSLLYSDDDLARLTWQKVYLPAFQEEIPMPPAPSYR